MNVDSENEALNRIRDFISNYKYTWSIYMLPKEIDQIEAINKLESDGYEVLLPTNDTEEKAIFIRKMKPLPNLGNTIDYYDKVNRFSEIIYQEIANYPGDLNAKSLRFGDYRFQLLNLNDLGNFLTSNPVLIHILKISGLDNAKRAFKLVLNYFNPTPTQIHYGISGEFIVVSCEKIPILNSDATEK